MKQFLNIFKFEFLSIIRNKVFIGFTIAIIVLLSGFLSFPRISSAIKGDSKAEDNKETITKIAIAVTGDVDEESLITYFKGAFGADYEIISTKENEKEIKDKVKNKEYDNAFIVDSPTHYSYITETKNLYDSKNEIATECMAQLYRVNASIEKGLNPQDAYKIMKQQINTDVVTIGKDQQKNFAYTYVVLMLIYMAIITYGQSVSQNVASEKGSRTMEVLVTSAKPINMMFGKILGSGCAGLTQLLMILVSGFGFYSINKEYWKDSNVIRSIFDMPKQMIPYTILFFVLGFFIYAFLYGALGSIATKTEDINTLILPVTFTLIIVFMVVISSMSSGKVDSTLMKVLSFVPFAAPLAMPVRLSMSTVSGIEIIASVAILVVSTFLIGYVSAIIYRIGVLMYGNKPTIFSAIKAIKQQRKS